MLSRLGGGSGSGSSTHRPYTSSYAEKIVMGNHESPKRPTSARASNEPDRRRVLNSDSNTQIPQFSQQIVSALLDWVNVSQNASRITDLVELDDGIIFSTLILEFSPASAGKLAGLKTPDASMTHQQRYQAVMNVFGKEQKPTLSDSFKFHNISLIVAALKSAIAPFLSQLRMPMPVPTYKSVKDPDFVVQVLVLTLLASIATTRATKDRRVDIASRLGPHTMRVLQQAVAHYGNPELSERFVSSEREATASPGKFSGAMEAAERARSIANRLSGFTDLKGDEPPKLSLKIGVMKVKVIEGKDLPEAMTSVRETEVFVTLRTHSSTESTTAEPRKFAPRWNQEIELDVTSSPYEVLTIRACSQHSLGIRVLGEVEVPLGGSSMLDGDVHEDWVELVSMDGVSGGGSLHLAISFVGDRERAEKVQRSERAREVHNRLSFTAAGGLAMRLSSLSGSAREKAQESARQKTSKYDIHGMLHFNVEESRGLVPLSSLSIYEKMSVTARLGEKDAECIAAPRTSTHVWRESAQIPVPNGDADTLEVSVKALERGGKWKEISTGRMFVGDLLERGGKTDREEITMKAVGTRDPAGTLVVSLEFETSGARALDDLGRGIGSAMLTKKAAGIFTKALNAQGELSLWVSEIQGLFDRRPRGVQCVVECCGERRETEQAANELSPKFSKELGFRVNVNQRDNSQKAREDRMVLVHIFIDGDRGYSSDPVRVATIEYPLDAMIAAPGTMDDWIDFAPEPEVNEAGLGRSMRLHLRWNWLDKDDVDAAKSAVSRSPFGAALSQKQQQQQQQQQQQHARESSSPVAGSAAAKVLGAFGARSSSPAPPTVAGPSFMGPVSKTTETSKIGDLRVVVVGAKGAEERGDLAVLMKFGDAMVETNPVQLSSSGTASFGEAFEFEVINRDAGAAIEVTASCLVGRQRKVIGTGSLPITRFRDSSGVERLSLPLKPAGALSFEVTFVPFTGTMRDSVAASMTAAKFGRGLLAKAREDSSSDEEADASEGELWFTLVEGKGLIRNVETGPLVAKVVFDGVTYAARSTPSGQNPQWGEEFKIPVAPKKRGADDRFHVMVTTKALRPENQKEIATLSLSRKDLLSRRGKAESGEQRWFEISDGNRLYGKLHIRAIFVPASQNVKSLTGVTSLVSKLGKNLKEFSKDADINGVLFVNIMGGEALVSNDPHKVVMCRLSLGNDTKVSPAVPAREQIQFGHDLTFALEGVRPSRLPALLLEALFQARDKREPQRIGAVHVDIASAIENPGKFTAEEWFDLEKDVDARVTSSVSLRLKFVPDEMSRGMPLSARGGAGHGNNEPVSGYMHISISDASGLVASTDTSRQIKFLVQMGRQNFFESEAVKCEARPVLTGSGDAEFLVDGVELSKVPMATIEVSSFGKPSFGLSSGGPPKLTNLSAGKVDLSDAITAALAGSMKPLSKWVNLEPSPGIVTSITNQKPRIEVTYRFAPMTNAVESSATALFAAKAAGKHLRGLANEPEVSGYIHVEVLGSDHVLAKTDRTKKVCVRLTLGDDQEAVSTDMPAEVSPAWDADPFRTMFVVDRLKPSRIPDLTAQVIVKDGRNATVINSVRIDANPIVSTGASNAKAAWFDLEMEDGSAPRDTPSLNMKMWFVEDNSVRSKRSDMFYDDLDESLSDLGTLNLTVLEGKLAKWSDTADREMLVVVCETESDRILSKAAQGTRPQWNDLCKISLRDMTDIVYVKVQNSATKAILGECGIAVADIVTLRGPDEAWHKLEVKRPAGRLGSSAKQPEVGDIKLKLQFVPGKDHKAAQGGNAFASAVSRAAAGGGGGARPGSAPHRVGLSGASAARPVPVGKLKVVIVEGRSLCASGSGSGVYAVCEPHNESDTPDAVKRTVKTNTLANVAKPRWDHSGDLIMRKGDDLIVSVFRNAATGKESMIGHLLIGHDELTNLTTPHSQWFALHVPEDAPRDIRESGLKDRAVFLSLQFIKGDLTESSPGDARPSRPPSASSASMAGGSPIGNSLLATAARASHSPQVTLIRLGESRGITVPLPGSLSELLVIAQREIGRDVVELYDEATLEVIEYLRKIGGKVIAANANDVRKIAAGKITVAKTNDNTAPFILVSRVGDKKSVKIPISSTMTLSDIKQSSRKHLNCPDIAEILDENYQVINAMSKIKPNGNYFAATRVELGR